MKKISEQTIEKLKMDKKVTITFLRNYAYDDSYFIAFQELTLSLTDAVELVNGDIAVITHIFD